MIIYNIPSSTSKKGENIIGACNHPSWTIFTRSLNSNNKHPRVLTYINIGLIKLCFLLRKDIFNHRDINLIFFSNHDIMCFIINVYSDNQQSTLKYLKNIEVNLNNILIITRDFNIRDNDWDFLYLYYSTHADILNVNNTKYSKA